MNGSPTTLDLITLGVAVFGAVAGAVAIGVQVGQFVLSGSRIKVSAKQALVGPGGALIGGNIWRQPQEGFDTLAVAVEVRNSGRMPATVQSWMLKIGGDVQYGRQQLPYNPEIPKRLDAGEQETWFATLDMVQRAINAAADVLGRKTTQIVAVVSLGDGRVVSSKPKDSLLAPTPTGDDLPLR